VRSSRSGCPLGAVVGTARRVEPGRRPGQQLIAVIRKGTRHLRARAYKPCELSHPPHTEQNLVSPEHAEALPCTPAAAVAVLLEQPAAVDYLVLSDITLPFDCVDGLRRITDDRVSRIPRENTCRAARPLSGSIETLLAATGSLREHRTPPGKDSSAHYLIAPSAAPSRPPTERRGCLHSSPKSHGQRYSRSSMRTDRLR
jgi:hypothetical protein